MNITSSISREKKTSKSYQFNRFQRAHYKRGPHAIPRKRQVSNEFHRIYSIKAGNREVCVESPLEADAIYWAEGNPMVTRICEQPIRIYEPLGKKPYYTFDLEISYKNGRVVLYEIKPESSLKEDESGRKLPPHWEKIEAWSNYTGHKSDVLTNKDLHPFRQAIANWRRLLPFVRLAVDEPEPDFEADLLHLVLEMQPATFAEMLVQKPTVEQENLIAVLALLIHTGQLEANLNEKRFSPMTILREITHD